MPAVAGQAACLWALTNGLAFMLHSGGAELSAATSKYGIAPGRWMPWCAAAQVAAAGLALRLPAARRRSRLFLASVALAATFATQLMYAWLVDLAVAADPAGHQHLRKVASAAVTLYGTGDLLAFMSLTEGVDLGRGRTFFSIYCDCALVFMVGDIICYYIRSSS